jgi:hypothetical protein
MKFMMIVSHMSCGTHLKYHSTNSAATGQLNAHKAVDSIALRAAGMGQSTLSFLALRTFTADHSGHAL